MRHEFTKGVALNEDEKTRLHSQLEAQKVRADKLIDTLREKRDRQFDFITDTRSVQMVPLDVAQRETFPEVDEVTRLEPREPQVVIMPKDPEAEWFEKFGPLAANAHAHGQIAAKTPIGARYYKHMLENDPLLLAANVNRWWDETPHDRLIRSEIIPSNGKRALSFARAFLSNKFRRLDNLEVMETMMPVLNDDQSPWQLKRAGITDVAVHVEAIAPQINGEVRVGDECALAVKIETGEVGNRALTVSLGFWRMICSNLAQVPTYTQKQVHLGRAENEFIELLSESTLRAEDQLVIDKMRDVVSAMYDTEKFNLMLNDARDSADRDKAGLKSPIKATELLATNANLNEVEGVMLYNEMMGAGDPTIFGLTNALTATARGLEFERKSELERIGGSLIAGREEWPRYVNAA
jgi:hypothetical protein